MYKKIALAILGLLSASPAFGATGLVRDAAGNLVVDTNTFTTVSNSTQNFYSIAVDTTALAFRMQAVDASTANTNVRLGNLTTSTGNITTALASTAAAFSSWQASVNAATPTYVRTGGVGVLSSGSVTTSLTVSTLTFPMGSQQGPALELLAQTVLTVSRPTMTVTFATASYVQVLFHASGTAKPSDIAMWVNGSRAISMSASRNVNVTNTGVVSQSSMVFCAANALGVTNSSREFTIEIYNSNLGARPRMGNYFGGVQRGEATAPTICEGFFATWTAAPITTLEFSSNIGNNDISTGSYVAVYGRR